MAETLNLLAFLQQAHNEASQLETALQRQQEANAELEKELTLCQLQMRASNTTTEEESKLAAAREDLAEHKKRGAATTAELTTTLAEFTSLRGEHASLRSKYDELSAAHETVNGELAEKQKAIDDAVRAGCKCTIS